MKEENKINRIKTYIIAILIPLGIGALAAFLTRGNMEIYNTAAKPPLAPPGNLFPIVWTILYVFMGVGSALVYMAETENQQARSDALFAYGLQLAVNFLWSLVFFNLQAYWFAFVVLVILWALVLWMLVKFSKVSKAAAVLQIPYLLWVTFAGYLNFMIA